MGWRSYVILFVLLARFLLRTQICSRPGHATFGSVPSDILLSVRGKPGGTVQGIYCLEKCFNTAHLGLDFQSTSTRWTGALKTAVLMRVVLHRIDALQHK